MKSGEGLEALLKGAKPAPLSDAAFTANVVAQLPAPESAPQPAWTAWAAIASILVGLVVVLLNPAASRQLHQTASQLSASFSSSWNGIGIAFAVLVGVWALSGVLGGEESRD